MSISRKYFDKTARGEEVTQYTLTNHKGASVSVIDFGGIVTSIVVPDRDGRLADVNLGFDVVDTYDGKGGSMGALIGRVGNRIGGAAFDLEGRHYVLGKNDGENNLHGGPEGFSQRMWKAESIEGRDGDTLRLTLTSPDGDQGFPGKLDVTVTMTVRDASGEEGGATPLEPDMVFARRLADAAQRLSEGLGVPNDLTVSRLMAMPGVLVPVRPEAGESEEDAWGVLEPVLADAVAQFLDARAREGERLGADMLGKIARIRTLAAELAAASEEDVRTLRVRFEERLRSLIGQADVQPDEARIITECAVFADRISVDEELVRLSSHLDTLEGLLHTDDAVGRKIDFMLQETNREVNTVGSKCSNAGMARLVAEIKNELEKIREQVQNIE